MIRRVKSVIVANTPEPLSIAEMEQWVRKTMDPDETKLMQELITSCRDLFERTTGRTLILKTHTIIFDSIPGGQLPWWQGVLTGARTAEMGRSIDLELPPAVSIESISTFDVNNTEFVWDAANYYLDNSDPEQIPRICLNIGATWPTNLRPRDALKVIVTAGYGDVFPLPTAMKTALKQMVAYYYNNRGDSQEIKAGSYCTSFVLNDIMTRSEDGRPRGLNMALSGEFTHG